MATVWATEENKRLAETVVETFLPNSVATLESLAGIAERRAAESRRIAWDSPRWEWPRLFDIAERHECIAARFRDVLTWEPMTGY